MPTVWLVPAGTDSADSATDGDYLLRPAGRDAGAGLYEVGTQSGGCTWIGTLSSDLLPPLPDVDAPQEAPEQATVLAAAQGVESAQAHRGG
ncbi:MAG TPA: hypothetical protein VNU26_08380 [Mycobacteriales bacterium]|nr:hypothetical protein [Mycobacteriales bacterium]